MTAGCKRTDPLLFGLIGFIFTSLLLLTIQFSFSTQYRQYEEERGIASARALSLVAGNETPSQVAAFIEKLSESVDEAYVVSATEVDRYGLSRGTRYLFHTDPERVGSELTEHTDPREKEIFDRSQEVLAGAESNISRLVSAPETGLGNTSPYFSIHRLTDASGAVIQQVDVPVVSPGGSLVGVAGLSLDPLIPAPQVDIFIWITGLALFSAGFWLLATYFRGIALISVISLSLSIALGGSLLWESRTSLTLAADYSDAMSQLISAAELYLETEAGPYIERTYQDAPAVQVEGYASLIWTVMFLSTCLLLLFFRFLRRVTQHLLADPWSYLYILPAMAGMLLLVFGPFLFGIGLAFFERDMDRFVPVGLAHFSRILSGQQLSGVSFYWTLGVTLLWTVTNVVLHLSIGLTLALLLNDSFLKLRGVYRTLLILPWAIPNYITALVWRGMFDSDDGVVNQLIELMGGGGIDWLSGSFGSAFTANLITNIWLGFPFMMVVSLGALQSIPQSLYEAAEVDGANRWQQFRQITLPLLKPALFPAVILGTIWTFNMFNIIYLVSGGGPNHTTEILITEAYKAFWQLGRWGYAAAYSVIIFAILLTLSWGLNRLSRATEGAFE